MRRLPLIAAFVAVTAMAEKGYITPTSITVTFTKLSLKGPGSRGASLVDGSFTKEFLKGESDFSASSLSSLKFPEGNWSGVQVCYSTTYKVKIDGEAYSGASGAAFSDGDTLVSVGTNGRDAGSLAKTGTAREMTFLVDTGGKAEYCGDTVYERPICVSTDKTKCEAESLHLNPSEQKPDINLLLNMGFAFEVDAVTGALNAATSQPHPFLGKPGAAMHLLYSVGEKRANITLLFTPEKKVTVGFSYGTGGSVEGFCTGYSAPTITGTGSLKIVTAFDPVTGRVQFPAAQCGSSDNCPSTGMLTMSNVMRSAGSLVLVTCPPDANASPANLGAMYTGGSGVSGDSLFSIQRIVDPANILGICATGTCGSYP